MQPGELGVDRVALTLEVKPIGTRILMTIESSFVLAAHLLKVMAAKPDLRVMVVGGYFDTAASAGADDYLLSRPGLDLKRITSRHFVGGHMFYTNPESRTLFAGDLRTFIEAGK